MANAIITFTRANDDNTVADGPRARTEELAIDGTTRVTTLEAAAGENIVEVLALADAWIAVGSAPGPYVENTAAGTRRRPIKSGERLYLTVRSGNNADHVAVRQRT